MRRSFYYILIGSLALCVVGFVFEKTNQTEPVTQMDPNMFGHNFHIDLSPTDTNFCHHFVAPFNKSASFETKNSPGSIDLDY